MAATRYPLRRRRFPSNHPGLMFETVEIPVWALILGAGLALIAFLDRIIGPWLRWMLRRWVNRTIAEMNQRLDLRLKPFTLTSRRVIVDRLLFDSEVMEAVEAHSKANDQPRDVSFAEAEHYAREIVPAFSAVAYFKFGTRVSRWFCDMMYRVKTTVVDDAMIARLEPKATVVFVMNHRSNMDYLLVTYLAAERSALAYAVGEWAQVWPLNTVIRAMGGYFIRRRSRNALYRRVLARYVRMATEGGQTQAVFPEGGLSLDGKLQQPKLGLLSYIVDGQGEEGAPDVLFVPVGINYDRVLEDRILTSAERDRNGRPRFRVPVFGSIVFVVTAMLRRMFGWYSRHGHAFVTFGEPLSLSAHKAGGEQRVEALGAALRRRIGRAVPLVPVALVAEALLEADGPVAEGALIDDVCRRRADYLAHGAVCPLDDADYPEAVRLGLTLLVRRHILSQDANGYEPSPNETALLTYYANSIAHLSQQAVISPEPA